MISAIERLGHQLDQLIEPGTVTIDGTPFDCAVLDNGRRGVPTEAGWQTRQELRVDIAKTALPTPPEQSDRPVITYESKTYLLDEVLGHHSSSATWTLRLHRDL